MLGMGGSGLPGYLSLTSSTIPANGLYLPSANTVGIATNGTLRVSVSTTALSTSLNTIIGSTSVTPDGTLHVHTATAGTVTASTAGDDLVVENSANGGITILVPDPNDAALFFGSPSKNNSAFLRYNYAGSEMVMATERAGSSLYFRADNSITNLTLSGASGSELATFAGNATLVSGVTAWNATAIPAGGTAGTGYKFSSTANFGIFFGSGAPTLIAAKGSIYLRSDGTTTNDRSYIATDSAGTWTALTTVA